MTRVLRYSPLLLLAAALVALAVFFVNQAPPASADHGRLKLDWSATLTVGSIGTSLFGCDDAIGAGVRCTPSDLLTDNDFTFDFTEYRITAIRNLPSSGGLAIELDRAIPDSLKSALTFHVGNRQFALADASVTGMSASWSNTGVSWSGGGVQLKLTAPYWTGVDLYGGGLVHHSDGAQTLDFDERGGSTFMVRLDQAPTANVTITLQKNFSQCSACGREYHGNVNAATVSPKTLTFTTSNWQTGQTVSVNGVQDSDSVHEHLGIWAFVSIAGGATSDDPYRNPERVNGVWVTIIDGTDDGSDHGGL